MTTTLLMNERGREEIWREFVLKIVEEEEPIGIFAVSFGEIILGMKITS